ncbi:DUF1249 domain-containing protein [Marinicella gelatinilytica]|uniref:DUF1249 domain-containing protein n=1 Tax=Marinicella gelatinilytica TaxID=2996017 RepID=UPI002260EECC|nr:DUF1249 domain-containing protein [Marinicella gelatinilytica]MCX7546020.1 DUF1249 domain-containing protein [Marinicella gelatinilytica]
MQRPLLNSRYWRYQLWAQNQHIGLQDWHEDNFRLLMRLLPQRLQPGVVYVSQPNNQPTLQVTRTEEFKYTSELHLSLLFEDESSDTMVVRIYHDMHLAELWQAHEFDRLFQQLGGRADCRLKAQRRYSLNCFFNKWLRHVMTKGYMGSPWQMSDHLHGYNPSQLEKNHG